MHTYITLHYITLHYITLHYIHAHIHTEMHAFIHTYMHTCIHACMHAYKCTYTSHPHLPFSRSKNSGKLCMKFWTSRLCIRVSKQKRTRQMQRTRKGTRKTILVALTMSSRLRSLNSLGFAKSKTGFELAWVLWTSVYSTAHHLFLCMLIPLTCMRLRLRDRHLLPCT